MHVLIRQFVLDLRENIVKLGDLFNIVRLVLPELSIFVLELSLHISYSRLFVLHNSNQLLDLPVEPLLPVLDHLHL